MVGKPPNDKLKREIQLGHETGLITFVLWFQRAEFDFLNFNQENVVVIENAISSVFNKNIVLTSAKETSIRVMDKEMDLKLPASASELKKNAATVSCVKTNVSAMKGI